MEKTYLRFTAYSSSTDELVLIQSNSTSELAHPRRRALVPDFTLGYFDAVSRIAERITVDSEQCGGRPCVREMRIGVSDVLDLFAAGPSPEQILEELPGLEDADLEACLKFASRWLDHPVLVA